MQIKTAMRDHLTPTRPIEQKTRVVRRRRICTEVFIGLAVSLSDTRECHMIQQVPV